MSSSKSHPVRNSVIAGLIVVAIVSLLSLVPGGWNIIWRLLRAVLKWLTSSITIPIWFFLLLLLGTVGLLLMMILITIVGKSKTRETDYTSDIFLGLRWRWRYGKSGIYSLACFCPKCDLQVYPCNTSSYNVVPQIAFKCEDCGHVLATFDTTHDELEDRVKRYIQKNLRTGLWKSKTTTS